jgi:competence protein ComEC
MNEVSAPNIVVAPLEPARRRLLSAIIDLALTRIETFLEAERGQLPLWFVACFGAGIAGWFALAEPRAWTALIAFGLALASAGGAMSGGRLGRSMALAGLAIALGCATIWWRSDRVAAPRLDYPRVVTFKAHVERVEERAAKDDVRLTLAPIAESGLPPRVRVSVANKDLESPIARGAVVAVRARLQSPPPMTLPGSHDFARDAWFAGIGAVGRAIGPVTIEVPGKGQGLDALRGRLSDHIMARLPGSGGAIATALVTGDQAGVADEDAEAMRRSGLTHLLSVSGLHIAAVVGAAMFIALRLLALSERLALRFNLVLVSAGFGAAGGVAYTILTGMQVPTVRSCIAALLVLAGIALGRDAISLRLVAVGALVVLMFRPESIAGASFQLSFAAVTAIVALHSVAPVKIWLSPREETVPLRLLRSLGGLLLTGLAVEIALMPFALYHFHRAGVYGVGANLIAIPLTTFVIMPLEAAALAFDSVGLGGPLWSAAGWAIRMLLTLAHVVSSADGAVTMLPTMSRGAFAAMVLGGLWLVLWTGRIRWVGLLPLVFGAIAAATAPVPDVLITGDGRHVAILDRNGTPLLLRARAGDYMRDLLSESAAFDGEPLSLEDQPLARCSRDACVADIDRDGQAWRLLAIRSRDRIEWRHLTRLCADADIVVAERRLPRGCTPRWLKFDRASLEEKGGVAVYLSGEARVATVSDRVGRLPWGSKPANTFPPRRRQLVLHTANSLPDGSMK